MDIILSAPETQDEGVWKYEHLRQFCMELNGLAVKLQSECKHLRREVTALRQTVAELEAAKRATAAEHTAELMKADQAKQELLRQMHAAMDGRVAYAADAFRPAN